MPLEDIGVGATIASLDATHPQPSDPRTQAPQIFQNIKKALQQTFPHVSATVNAVAAELDFAAVGGTASGTCVFKSQAEFMTGYKVSASLTTVLADGYYQGSQVYRIDSSNGLQHIGGDGNFPLLMNAGFDVRQDTSGTITLSPTARYIVDGWRASNSSSASVVAYVESNDVPSVALMNTLVTNVLRFRAAVPVTVPGSAGRIELTQPIEGYDFRAIARRQFILGFSVKGSAPGVHNVAFKNTGSDQAYIAEYTLSATGTWEYKTITVPASPSTGTWDYSAGIGLRVTWPFVAGQSYRATPGEWTAMDAYVSTAGVNDFSATDAYIMIGPAFITPGSVGKRWTPEPIADVMTRCTRYYHTSYEPGTAPGTASATQGMLAMMGSYDSTANELMATIEYPTPMRATPTITYYNPITGGTGFFHCGNGSSSYTATTLYAGTRRATIVREATGPAAAPRFYIHYVANARL